jgi:hypothetical protein
MKSGSLNLLEPSGPVQACTGIALPLPLPLPFTYNIQTNLQMDWLSPPHIPKSENLTVQMNENIPYFYGIRDEPSEFTDVFPPELTTTKNTTLQSLVVTIQYI